MDNIGWGRMPGEPVRWYNIFVRYYLGAGASRTIYGAYHKYSRDAGPEQFAKSRKSTSAPQSWYVVSERYKWADRAVAYEMDLSEQASKVIMEAGVKLRLLATRAVEALELSLLSERYRVSAAKEILDRAGLPAVTHQVVTNKVTLNSDDMDAAIKEVEEWESAKHSESG